MNISRSERFWKKVSIKELDGCWIWKGKATTNRGFFRWDGITVMSASRAAYMLKYGYIEEGMSVLHKCNNVLCVNPAHLYLGDRIDNMRDFLATKKV